MEEMPLKICTCMSNDFNDLKVLVECFIGETFQDAKVVLIILSNMRCMRLFFWKG